MSISVEMVEVGPRDGLQNEKTLVSTDDKLAFIRRAIAAGSKRIEMQVLSIPSLSRKWRMPKMSSAN